MAYLFILIGYAVLMIVFGVILSRRVRESSDFFVAGRGLSAGLLFSTLLAANIGAGSTVGATGAGYRDGLSAWWWVGSAGIGSLILAFTVGPRIWRVARDHNFYTVGDYLEFRYNRAARGLVALLLWFGTLFILAGQLIAVAWILNVTVGISKTVGCLIGAVVTTAYFASGGLFGTARVNALQLIIKLIGFGLAAVYLFGIWGRLIGDYSADLKIRGIPNPEAYFSFWGNGTTALKYLAILVPSFVISPGLLQKIFGASEERNVKIGVALNALCLLGFAFIPAIFGVLARYEFPDIGNRELALPMLLTQSLPIWIGGLLLGAIFAAEVSTADAVLFMLSTSLSKDLYQTFINPQADDRRLLLVARTTAVVCGALGAGLGILLETVIQALTIFYTLLSAALFLPLIAGLYTKRVTARAAISAMLVSVAVTMAMERLTAGQGYLNAPSLLWGALAGLVVMVVVSFFDGAKTESEI
ncbi:MAG: sodium:solute symporter family protein [Blastocatellales bacterium]